MRCYYSITFSDIFGFVLHFCYPICDILGNVSELCWDEDNEQYVFMGGNIYSSREEIQSLEPVPFDNYEKNKGAHGFRLVINAPQNPSNQYLLAQYYNQDNLVRKNTENY